MLEIIMTNRDPYIYRIKEIYKVIDGDTIDASIDLGFGIYLTRKIRLAGIDTPESRTTDVKEKIMGLESKDWLKHRVENAQCILIKTELPDSTEKYGRIIGHLYINGEETSLSTQMIDAGYALLYDGGIKNTDLTILETKRNQQ